MECGAVSAHEYRDEVDSAEQELRRLTVSGAQLRHQELHRMRRRLLVIVGGPDQAGIPIGRAQPQQPGAAARGHRRAAAEDGGRRGTGRHLARRRRRDELTVSPREGPGAAENPDEP